MSDAIAISFACESATVQGVLHRGAAAANTGVLVVVGGPQYRVGSHRQFVLLARALAHRGIPVLRFDYRGLGDSPGEARTFESIDPDIRAAIDEFFRRVPSLKRVVIWGLCDAASAALLYSPGDARVAGLVLLNPWVRSAQTVAQAYLRGYYLRRLFSASAWRDMLSGGRLFSALRTVLGLVREARGGGGESAAHASAAPEAESPLVGRMRRGFAAFRGPILLVLSGDDITAAEFKAATANAPWRRLLQQACVTHRALDAADHTFSCRAWRDEVAQWTGEWVIARWPVKVAS